MRFALLFVTALTATFPTAAQMIGKDLDAATVRARRLSLENLLDSVIKHARTSYLEPQTIAVTQHVKIYHGGDTPFTATVPAYLIKNNDFVYALKRDTTEAVSVSDQLPSGGHERILNLSAFPESTNLLNLLERAASRSVTQKGFYATSGWGDSLRYHVIVPHSFKRSMLLKMFTAKMDEDTIMAFESFTIRRKGWVLEEKAWKVTSAPRDLVKIFRKTKSYRQADSLMEAARAKEDVPQTVSVKRWAEGPEGRYVFAGYSMRDNLMFLKGSTGKPSTKYAGYIYEYKTTPDTSGRLPNPDRLRYVLLRSFFNEAGVKDAPLAIGFSDRD